MKLAIFVHDLHKHIGHSRAIIELVNALSTDQKSQISDLRLICFTSTPPRELFTQFPHTIKFIKVPFPNIRPFLFKMIFYHLYTYLYSKIFLNSFIKISIGIASLDADIVNVQFVHEQWKKIFFSQRKLKFHEFVYKKLLFLYFEIAENFVFKNKSTRFIVIARFIEQYLKSEFALKDEQFIYLPSAVNLHEFQLSTDEDKIWNELSSEYPVLNAIDRSKPVALFIGALERKGIDRAIRYSIDNNLQLIIIGKPENNEQFIPPKELKSAYIPFTKRVRDFYQISDLFIFPTYYEPFGLVIIEAFMMGLEIIVPNQNVGASEVIQNATGVHFHQQSDPLPIIKFRKISIEEKRKRIEQRLNEVSSLSWENQANKFQSMLFKN